MVRGDRSPFVCETSIFAEMAAIISRITRENRARKDRLAQEISSAKCNYLLEEFPDRYVPEKHNKYLKNRSGHYFFSDYFLRKSILANFLAYSLNAKAHSVKS